MKKLIFILTLVLLSNLSWSYEFIWKMDTNEVMRVKSFVKQNIYTNNAFMKYVEIINKASLDIKSISQSENKKYYGIEGIFYVFSKDYSEETEFKLEEQNYSKYIMDENGKMVISKEYLMPITRDVPIFIKTNLNIGDEWLSKGKEVHKLGFTEVFDIVEVDFTTYYKFSGITNINGKNIGIIDIKYGFSKVFPKARIVDYLSGTSEIKYYWNLDEGKPYSMEENYFFNAIYKNGLSVIYSGTSVGELEVVKKWNKEEKEKVISQLAETISNQKGIELKTEENQINISIPDILFDFNSSKVKEEFFKILSSIANKIKNYKQFDIIVEGHTDDIGSDEYNMKLSESRAKEVAKIFIENGINPERVSYIGFGKTKPKVPNISSENRAKNRRVEIKFIWGK
ncbi:MAG: OmpA family protein [Brevinematia bacterium]